MALALAVAGCARGYDASGFSPVETAGEAGSATGPSVMVFGADDDNGDRSDPVQPSDGDDPPARQPGEPSTYVVQSGDFLGRIADRHGCSVGEIRRANNLRGDLIHPGDELTIPDCDPDAPEPELVGGDEYVIAPGDVLELIAERAGCTVSQLMQANNMRNDVIYAGRSLTIPDCGADADPSPMAQADPVPEDVPEPVAPVADDEQGAVNDGSPDDDEVTHEEDADDADPRADLEDGALYTVVAGDILGVIAGRFGCAISEVQAANNISGDLIRVGQTLRIPEECSGEPVEVVQVSRVRTGGRDTDTLPRLMRERGFDPPSRFKALVLAIDFNASRSQVVGEQLFDYDGTGDDTDWNPASTVKLFAAIAAMQEIRDLGFTGSATLRFDGDESFTLDALVQEALGPSSNIAYNYLVTFVGHDNINDGFFSGQNGFQDTALRRPYERSAWMEMGYSSSFRTSPEIVISENGRTRTLEAREGDADVDCSGSACTTLRDLAECMRRLMLQEQLPSAEHYGLSRHELLTIRRTLRSLGRSRGEEVVDALRESFPGDGVNLYHKAGFSGDWYSDTVYIYDPQRYPTQAWIVALAGYPGRDSLTEAAELIGELIAEGHL